MATSLPLLLLGGGGYVPADAARAWTVLTAQVADVPLDPSIPEHDFYPTYSPSFRLHTDTNAGRPDQNTSDYIKALAKRLQVIAKHIPVQTKHD